MWQVRTYDLESGSKGPAHIEWTPNESMARRMETEGEKRGMVVLVLNMETAGLLRAFNDVAVNEG